MLRLVTLPCTGSSKSPSFVNVRLVPALDTLAVQARPRADVAIRSNVTSRGNVTANARAPPQEEEEVQVALSRALAALAATFGRYFSLRKLCALQDHLLNKVA